MAFDFNSALGEKLTSATKIAFAAGIEMIPKGARALYNYETVDSLYQIHSSYSMDGFGSMTGFGANYSLTNPTLGDEKTYTQNKFTRSFETIAEMADFSSAANGAKFTKEIINGGTALGKQLAKRMELDGQLEFGMGAGASYTNQDGFVISTVAADGLSNFNSAHTVNGSSSTFSNVGTTAFGQTGLQDAELLARSFLNHDGRQTDVRMDTIFSARDPEVTNLIREYNVSSGHVEDANRGINTYQGKYNHVVLEYLDATNVGGVDSAKNSYWGLCAAGNDNLKMKVFSAPKVHMPDMVQRNRNILIQADAIYAQGFHDPVAAVLMTA